MSKNRVVVCVIGSLGLMVGTAMAGSVSPTFSVAARAGQSVPGIGLITLIDNHGINNTGKWLVEADTDHADTNTDQVMLLNGVLQYREGQALAAPAGATIDSFDAVNINNNANSGWNFFLGGQTTTTDSGIFFDDTLVLQESTVSSSPAFNNPTPYIGFFEVKMNDSNQMLVVASVDDPVIPSTVDRAMVRIDYNAMAGTYIENVISKEGDLILGNAIADFGTGPHEFAINAGGSALYIADTTAATANDGFLMRDTTVLAQEGLTVVTGTGGRLHETIIGRGVDMNDSGDWVMRGNLTGDTTTDECLIKNNEVFVQEGDSLPDISPFQLTAFGLSNAPVSIDNAGNVVWFGDWDDADTTRDTGIFWNDQLIVQEGVTVVEGLLVFSIANGQDSISVSDNGQWILFEATLRDVALGVNYNAAVTILIPGPGAIGVFAAAGLVGVRRRR